MAVKRGEPGAELPPVRTRRVPLRAAGPVPVASGERSDVARGIEAPAPPFWGSRVTKGVQLADIVGYLDEQALFKGRWGLRAVRGGPGYAEIVETEALPRLRAWLDRVKADGLGQFAVVHGYWPCWSQGNDLVVADPDDQQREIARFTFPRQVRERRLCIADFFRDEHEAAELGPDTLALQLVTMGSRVSQETGRLFGADAYRDYLELHGLSVQLTEALAELTHQRIRSELGLSADDDPSLDEQIAHQAYRGSRYSFGYPACPDLELRSPLCDLLQAERIGVELSEEFQLNPEQSTDALIVHHPEAKYFSA